MAETENIGLTVAEAAAILRISERTMSQLCATGKVKALRLGSRAGWRIHKDALDEFVRKGGAIEVWAERPRPLYIVDDEMFAAIARSLKGDDAEGAHRNMGAAAELMKLALAQVEKNLADYRSEEMPYFSKLERIERDVETVKAVLPRLERLIRETRHDQNGVCIHGWTDMYSDEEMAARPAMLERYIEAIQEEWEPEHVDEELRRRGLK